MFIKNIIKKFNDNYFIILFFTLYTSSFSTIVYIYFEKVKLLNEIIKDQNLKISTLETKIKVSDNLLFELPIKLADVDTTIFVAFFASILITTIGVGVALIGNEVCLQRILEIVLKNSGGSGPKNVNYNSTYDLFCENCLFTDFYFNQEIVFLVLLFFGILISYFCNILVQKIKKTTKKLK